MRVPLDWIQEFVSVRIGAEKLAHVLTMSGLEVESLEKSARTSIFEIGVTPNRPDCLSVKGIAREVAAITAAKFDLARPVAPKGEDAMSRAAKVSVQAKLRCPRYAARVIRNVKIGPSPQWMSARLAACGIRSINNIVDATNYVMLETGQPLHAFDLTRLAGPRIVVKTARDGEVFTTLDGVKRTLCADDLLICDANGAVALAGVMGGENSEVHENTTDVLLESAYFAPSGVRRTSKRIGLSTESSKRFERGVDPDGVMDALHRLTSLIVETAGGTPTSDWVDIYPQKIKPGKVSLTASETNRILGTDFTAPKIAAMLKRLGFSASASGSEKVVATVPTYRPDLTRSIDLIEEVARLFGYDNIKESMPEAMVAPIDRPQYAGFEDVVREALTGSGLCEAVLYGFASEEAEVPFSDQGPAPIRIANPLSNDQGVMITTLIPGIVEAARQNMLRQREDVRFFALQRVYHRTKAIDSVDEPRMVAGLITGHRWPGSWDRAKETVDFYDAKLCVENVISALELSDEVIFQRGDGPSFLHPGRFSYVLLRGARVGFVGQIHPDLAQKLDISQDVYAFELNFEMLAERAHSRTVKFREFSRFPFVTRDVAIVLDEGVPLCEVEKVINESGIKTLDDVRLFDVFRGGNLPAGKKSMAISLRFSRTDRTLTDDEVTAAHAKIVSELSAKLGAVLR